MMKKSTHRGDMTSKRNVAFAAAAILPLTFCLTTAFNSSLSALSALAACSGSSAGRLKIAMIETPMNWVTIAPVIS